MGAAAFLIGRNRGILLGGGLPAPLLLLEELLVVIVTPIFPDSLDKTSAFRFVPHGSLRLMIGLSSLLLLSPSAISGCSATNSGGGGVMLPAFAQPIRKMLQKNYGRHFVCCTTRTLLKCGLFLVGLREAKENTNAEYFIRIYEG